MNVFLVMLPIILIVLIGYISSLFSILKRDSGEQFSQFAFYMAIPCQVFYVLSKTPFSQAINMAYILAYALCAIVTGSVIFFISALILKKSYAESSLNIMGSSMTNTAYFAIPVFILLFNNPAPVIAILLFQLVVMTTFILIMIEHDTQTISSKNVVSIIIKNPIIVASICGIIFSFFHLAVPDFLASFLNLLGSAAAPLILFSLGQSLYSDLQKIAKNDLIEVSMLIATKLIIFPVCAFFIGKYIFQLNAFWLSSLIIMSAMPAPNNMFIFALKYQLDVKKASTVVAISTLLSFVTLNVLLNTYLGRG
jgi:malonate transporter